MKSRLILGQQGNGDRPTRRNLLEEFSCLIFEGHTSPQKKIKAFFVCLLFRESGINSKS